MELIGGNEIKLPSLKRENISYVFPNKVSLPLINVNLLLAVLLVTNNFYSFIWKAPKLISQIAERRDT